MSPLQALIEDGLDIRDALWSNTESLEMAIENEHRTKRTAKEAQATYDAIEAEWEYDQVPPENGTKITVEQRKVFIAAARAKAQRAGILTRPLAMANAARYDADDAAMALQQCEKRYSATRAAAELTAAILNAAK